MGRHYFSIICSKKKYEALSIFKGLHFNCQFCDDAAGPIPINLYHEPDVVENHQEGLQQDHQQVNGLRRDRKVAMLLITVVVFFIGCNMIRICVNIYEVLIVNIQLFL